MRAFRLNFPSLAALAALLLVFALLSGPALAKAPEPAAKAAAESAAKPAAPKAAEAKAAPQAKGSEPQKAEAKSEPAAKEKSEKPVRHALVLATFGTTQDQKEDPLRLVRAELAKRHPEMTPVVAYTSAHVAKTRIAKGLPAPSPAQALANLSAEGYTDVTVVSLQLTPGKEYDILRDIAGRFQNLPKGLRSVRVSEPLIGTDEGAENLARALLASLPKERHADDAVVFVGHGAENPAGTLAYPALQAALWQRDAKAFVGTIEGRYNAAHILDLLRAKKIKTVWLTPLLSVAGEHAANDIFGAEDDSWTQMLSGAGMTVKPLRRGLLEVPEVAALWVDLADEALSKQ